MIVFFFFKQKTAYEMRISDWSSDVCSSDLRVGRSLHGLAWYACLLAQHGRRLRTQGYDLLLASWGYPDAVGTRWLARRLGLPYVVKVHGSDLRSEEHTSELQSLMRISYAVFCLKKKTKQNT